MNHHYKNLAVALAMTACAMMPASAFETEGGCLYGFVTSRDGLSPPFAVGNYYKFDLNNLSSYEKFGSGSGLSNVYGQASTFTTEGIVAVNINQWAGYKTNIFFTPFTAEDWNGYTANGKVSGFKVVTDITEDNGTFYGWFSPDTNGTEWTLASFDKDTGDVTKVGDATTTTRIQGLTSDGSGNLYGLATDSYLYSISKTDGSLNPIGKVGNMEIKSSNPISLCYDAGGGRILFVSYEYDDSEWSNVSYLYAIDPATAAPTKLGRMPIAMKINGLYTPVTVSANAPGKVEDLSATNDGSDNDIKVTFTVPSKNHAGVDMSPNIQGLTYTIMIDGEVKVEAKATTPGASVSETITSTPGTHSVTVYVSQTTYGDGLKTSAELFVGMDTPGAVTDLRLKADGSDVTLTWTAPQGVHGAKYDSAKLSYNVTRLPDNVEVATGLTATTFSETIDTDKLQGYSYMVTTVYDGQATDYTAKSNTAFAGPAFEVTRETAFTRDFENCETNDDLDFFTCYVNTELGSDEDGNKYLKIPSLYRVENPKIITTALKLRARHTYKLTFKYRLLSLYGSSFQVDLVDAPVDGYTVVKNIMPNTSMGYYDSTYSDWTDEKTISKEFEVDENGVYFISINNSYIACEWNFDDFVVEDITEPGKPMSVTDFAVTGDDVDKRKFTLSFKLPATDTNGDDPAMTKATLSRGDEVLNTWTEGLTPGAGLTWVEEKAPLGQNVYSVTVENANGTSTPVEVTAKSGRDYDLTLESVENPASVVRCKSFEVKAVVRNNGNLKAPNADDAVYTVSLVQVFNDGSRKVVDAFDGRLLAPDETSEYVFTVTTDATSPDPLRYYVATVYDADEYPDDNLLSNEFEIEVVTPEMPSPSLLEAAYDDGKTILTWAEPEYNADEVDLLGYNVYCNGAKLNDAPVAETTYAHEIELDKPYAYAVSAVYKPGESPRTPDLTVNWSALGSIAGDNGIRVTADNGEITVTGAKGRRVTIVAASGLTVMSTVAKADSLTLRVVPGVYAVKAGNVVVKIVL